MAGRGRGTSFKTLLKTQATPDAGGGLGKIKEHRDRLQDLKRKAPAPGIKRPSEEPAQVVRTAAAPTSSHDFIPAPAYAGPRPGFVFKLDAMGTGYYRDALQPLPPASSSGVPAGFFDDDASAPSMVSAPPAGRAEADAQPAGSLPAGFFDNPREDPANAAKKTRVSETQKGERLRMELAEFEKSIQPEVKLADEVDELEDEADAELRAAEHDREQLMFAQRVRALRERAHAEQLKAAEAHARATQAVGLTSAAAAKTDGGSSASDEEDAGDLLVDWRSKNRG